MLKKKKLILDNNYILSSIILTLFVIVNIKVGGWELTAITILFVLLLMMMILISGCMIISFIPRSHLNTYYPMAFLVGMLFLSFPATILVLIFSISAFKSIVICALINIFVIAVYFKTSFSRKMGVDNDVISVLIISIVIIMSGYSAITGYSVLHKTGLLPIWNDYYIHGVTINTLGSHMANVGSYEIAGEKLILYHYVPFLIPASLQPILHAPGLLLSIAVLLPLGLLSGGLGLYALASQIAGKRIGLLSTIAIINIPFYLSIIQSGWFDFNWMTFASPTVGYGIGASMGILVFMLIYLEHDSGEALWLSVMMLICLFLVKIQMFLLVAPVLVLFVLFRRLNISSGIAIIICLLLCFLFSVINVIIVRTGWGFVGLLKSEEYLKLATTSQLLFGMRLEVKPEGIVADHMRLIVIYTAILGIFIIVYPVYLWFYVRRYTIVLSDLVPLLFMVFFLFFMYFAPIAWTGDFTEYKHRSFPLLYSVSAVFGMCYALRSLEHILLKNYISITVVFLMSLISVYYFISVNPGAPSHQTLQWGYQYFNVKMQPGLMKTAEYIRSRSKRKDIFVMGIKDIEGTSSNHAIELISLSNIPSYISRPEIFKKHSLMFNEMVENRVKVVNRLAEAAAFEEIVDILRDNNIRWYLINHAEPPAWDPLFAHAAFKAGDYATYDSAIK
jgi:hypothetical protein